MTNIILTTRSRRLFLDDFIPLKIKGKHKASGYTGNIISDFSIRHFLLSLHHWRKSAFFLLLCLIFKFSPHLRIHKSFYECSSSVQNVASPSQKSKALIKNNVCIYSSMWQGASLWRKDLSAPQRAAIISCTATALLKYAYPLWPIRDSFHLRGILTQAFLNKKQMCSAEWGVSARDYTARSRESCPNQGDETDLREQSRWVGLIWVKVLARW